MANIKTNNMENNSKVIDIMVYIESVMREYYPNLPLHKMNRLMRVFKEMDKSDWVESEIIMPSENHLPKDFWKI